MEPDATAPTGEPEELVEASDPIEPQPEPELNEELEWEKDLPLITKDGRELTLRPVNENTCRALIEKLGGMQLFRTGRIADLSADEQALYITNSNRLLRYLAGWGVVENPSEEEVEMLQALGLDSDIPNLRRAAWLMYLMYDEVELTRLTARVLILTWRS